MQFQTVRQTIQLRGVQTPKLTIKTSPRQTLRLTSSGAPGPQGIPGTPGQNGTPGVAGPTGPTGPQGDQGPVGPTGLTGAAGAKGATGSTGAKGATGSTGPAGPQGVIGPQGPVGATGAKGDIGAQGVPGPTVPDVSTFPVLVVNRNGGNDAGFQSVSPGIFATIQLVDPAVIDTHGGYNATTYVYTVQQTGLYQGFGKVRLKDGAPAMSFGLGIDIVNQDSPSFVWATFPTGATGGYNRFVLQNSRTFLLTAGQQVRLFVYCDAGQNMTSINKAELVLIRIR